MLLREEYHGSQSRFLAQQSVALRGDQDGNPSVVPMYFERLIVKTGLDPSQDALDPCSLSNSAIDS